MRGRKWEWIIRGGSFGLLVLIWEAVGRLQLVSPLFLSYPSAILASFWQPYEIGGIFSHMFVTLWMGLIGYVPAILTGIPTGLLLGRMPTVRKVVDPYIMALYVTPTFALLPLLLVLLGLGYAPLLVVLFGAVYSQVVINVTAGAESVDPTLIEAGRAYGAGRMQLFWKVILPATVPYIAAACRIGLGRGLVVLVFTEFYLGISGLGFFTAWAGQTLRTDALFAAIVVLMVLGLTGDEGLKLLQRRFFPWQVR